MILCEGLFPPVTGMPGVLAEVASDVGVVASVVEVGASVAGIALVLVSAGTLVLGTLVEVSCSPQAASNRETITSMVKNKLALFIRTKFLSVLSAGKIFPSAKDVFYY